MFRAGTCLPPVLHMNGNSSRMLFRVRFNLAEALNEKWFQQ